MGIGNKFYGYQMANLGGQIYYQAKEKDINDREKMKKLSNMPSLRRWYNDRNKLINRTSKHYKHHDRYQNECIVFKYNVRNYQFHRDERIISFGKEYSLNKENSKKILRDTEDRI